MTCRAFLYFAIAILLLPVPGFTQLCNGSLGDPVVNITFSSGSSNYTPTNGYTYTSSTCPEDGFYTITGATSGCFGSSWHTVTNDHTGNGGFMLVNASYTPGDFFLTTVSDLCPNTTYEFAAWILNVLNRSGIKPNITFRIETPAGQVLQEFQTGDILETSQAEWKQYGFFFTTPIDNASIVLRLTNNAPGGSGNDLALDDITFRPCGPEVTATVNAVSDTIDVCEGYTEVYSLNGTVSTAYTSPVYQWQLSTDLGVTWTDIAGANSILFQAHPLPAGNYWYRMAVVEERVATVTKCRINSNLIKINVHGKPDIDAGPDRVILSGNSATIGATANGDGLQFLWTPATSMSDPTILNPTVSPTIETIYNLSSISQYGCSKEDNMKVKVVADIFIPTAFTPNNDGLNDIWQIPYLDPSFGATVSVYNRWGQIVYYSEAALVSWNGKKDGMPQPSGAYVYMVRLKTDSGIRLMKGTLMLIR